MNNSTIHELRYFSSIFHFFFFLIFLKSNIFSHSILVFELPSVYNITNHQLHSTTINCTIDDSLGVYGFEFPPDLHVSLSANLPIELNFLKWQAPSVQCYLRLPLDLSTVAIALQIARNKYEKNDGCIPNTPYCFTKVSFTCPCCLGWSLASNM